MNCSGCGAHNEVGDARCRACGEPLQLDGNDSAQLSTVSPHALPVGTSLEQGNFILAGVLGQGGSGITYSGHDVRLERPVAIKEFFPPDATRREAVVQPANAVEFAAARQAFLEEARTLARFQDANIVDVYAVFEANETAYMVMECLRGQSLMQMLESRGPLPEDIALKYIEQVGHALSIVHSNGLLHQDVKPDNIVVCAGSSGDTERVVLIDFGLTRKIDAGTNYSTTRLSGVTRYGTAGYAPLEQYGRQTRLGPYTDVYALAATLYHLLTGTLPVEATDRAAGVDLPDVRTVQSKISAHVAHAIADALKMEPAARPQSAEEFLERLQHRPSPVAARNVFTPNAPFTVDADTAKRVAQRRAESAGESASQMLVMMVVAIFAVLFLFLLDYIKVVLKP